MVNRQPAGRCHVTRKVQYDDRSQAKRQSGPGMRPFRCAACSFWHVASPVDAIRQGDIVRSREAAERASGVDVHVVRCCPGCGGEGTAAVGVLHAAGCSHSRADVLSFPRRGDRSSPYNARHGWHYR